MRRANNKEDLKHEHIVICVDDLLIVSKSPQIILDALINKHKFKLKGTRNISYHLGCDFSRDGSNEL